VEQVEKFGKRIRLDSTEKNILMESERRESEQEVMESQTEPPSCYAGMSSSGSWLDLKLGEKI
jgi:hypothetical protein